MENPNPGLVVDHTITRRNMYDFFLVPQSVRQGTVTPTHYIVVHDSANFSPDILQRLSYKLCFLYYNWPGTVRVPACCQVRIKMTIIMVIWFFKTFSIVVCTQISILSGTISETTNRRGISYKAVLFVMKKNLSTS